MSFPHLVYLPFQVTLALLQAVAFFLLLPKLQLLVCLQPGCAFLGLGSLPKPHRAYRHQLEADPAKGACLHHP